MQQDSGLQLTAEDEPFWRIKTLEDMTPTEWESLCDGCARCCLVKLADEDTEEVHLTRLACRMLHIGACKCSDYPRRHELMPDCVAIDPQKVRELTWLPPTCAYRLVGEGQDLAWWHPLVSGDPETVHQAGISVRGWATSEDKADPDEYHRFIIRGFAPARSEPKRRAQPVTAKPRSR
jgi:uncharacterized cysteine cluster protein YcgN (CxxCxxCC family)